MCGAFQWCYVAIIKHWLLLICACAISIYFHWEFTINLNHKYWICLKIIYGDRRWLIDFKMFILLRGMKSMHLFIQFSNLNSFNHFHLKLCTKFCGAIRVVTGVQNWPMTIIPDGCRVWATRLASPSPSVCPPRSCSWPSVSWTMFWISKS